MKLGLSNRIQSINSSGIRRVFDLAATLTNPVNLSIGQPDYDAFPELKRGAIEAIESGKNGYTVTQGLPDLRQRIAVQREISLDVTSEYDITVTSGVSGGILLSYYALLDPGDEVLIPDPYFCMYPDLARLVNATPVFVPTYPDCRVTAASIEPYVTSKSKVIVLNSPANPTGVAMTAAELDEIISLARTHDLWLMYDEIYDVFSYDAPHISALGKYEKTIILNGFSKSFGITGWRVGYAIAPREVVQQMNKAQQYTFVCAPSIAQWGVVSGFDRPLEDVRIVYKKKRDLVLERLSAAYEIVPPEGAFYAFIKVPDEYSSGQKFVEHCVKNNLLCVPGNVFSQQDTHFRISFASSEDQLSRGMDILLSLQKPPQGAFGG